MLNLPPTPTDRTAPLDAQISDFILALPMLVFAMVAHEYAHAVAALHQGDDTAYTLGRVTLNPLPHIDPWMSLLLPALLWFGSDGQFTFGGAKPVPVNSRKFRNYRAGRHHRLGGRGRHQSGALAFVFARAVRAARACWRGSCPARRRRWTPRSA